MVTESSAPRARFREASRARAPDSLLPGECTTHERPGKTENMGAVLVGAVVIVLRRMRLLR